MPLIWNYSYKKIFFRCPTKTNSTNQFYVNRYTGNSSVLIKYHLFFHVWLLNFANSSTLTSSATIPHYLLLPDIVETSPQTRGKFVNTWTKIATSKRLSHTTSSRQSLSSSQHRCIWQQQSSSRQYFQNSCPEFVCFTSRNYLFRIHVLCALP